MLTIKQIEAAARDRRPTAYKLFDGKGLYVEIPPTGSLRWRLKYRYAGSEKRISLGVFPDVSLKEARERCEQARRLLAKGVDPSAQRKASRVAEVDTFEAVAREWYEKQAKAWNPSHGSRVLRRLELYVFPHIGRRSVGSITAAEVLSVLRRIEERGTIETAHRVQQVCGQVFRYAVSTSRAERNPCADLTGALTPSKTKHFAAITQPGPFAALLRAIDGYEGQATTRWALRLAPLVFVRPGELRQAEWSEFDLDAATWTVPVEKLKASTQDHVVPLSTQAVAILREAHALTGSGRYVFPSIRSKHRPMSDMTLNAALRRLGYAKEEVAVHGFRATARTMLAEVLKYPAELIEHQLAHAVRDPLGRAYNRTAFIDERRAMMQAWADYLDGLKREAEILPLRRVK